MKQLLPLFLFLFLLPCLAWAQYPTNGNQKITLGEQTTADGLIYRGVLGDTGNITPRSDTSAYIILDTVNHRFYNYNRATNVWSVTTIGSISSGLTGVLPVANGGTGQSTLTANKVMVGNGTNGVLTPTNLHYDNTNTRLGIGLTSPSYRLDILASDSMPTTVTRAINLLDLDTYTGSVSKFQQTLSVNTNQDVSTSMTNNGYLYGMNFQATSGSSGLSNNSGTLSSLNAISMIFGVTSAVNTPTINQANGLSITPFITSGTITDLASLRLNNPSGSGVITNNFAIFQSSSNQKNYFNGKVGIGQTTPTAVLHLKAGTATASTAPLKFTSGTNLTSPLGGEMEFNGTNLFFSPSTTRHTVNHGLTGSATLNFPSTTTLLSADLTITVTGAADGDVVSLGVPNAAVNANTSYSAWVSAANTVTVRFNNYSSGTVDPASALFKVFVTK
jgi:hypothetical protein